MSGFEIQAEFETAVHEAGHAIVGDALGLGVALLRVEGDSGLCRWRGAGFDSESLGGRFLLASGTMAGSAAVLLLHGEDPFRLVAWIREVEEYCARRTVFRQLAVDGTAEQRRRAWGALDDLHAFAQTDAIEAAALLSADPSCSPDPEAAVRLAASILSQRWPGVIELARAVLAAPRVNGARTLEGDRLASALTDARTRTRLAELLALDPAAGGPDA